MIFYIKIIINKTSKLGNMVHEKIKSVVIL